MAIGAEEQTAHSSSTCLDFCCRRGISDDPQGEEWLGPSGPAGVQQLTVCVCSGDWWLSASTATLSVDIRLMMEPRLLPPQLTWRAVAGRATPSADGTAGTTQSSTFPLWERRLFRTYWISKQLWMTRYLLSGTPISAEFRVNTNKPGGPPARWPSSLGNVCGLLAKQKRKRRAFSLIRHCMVSYRFWPFFSFGSSVHPRESSRSRRIHVNHTRGTISVLFFLSLGARCHGSRICRAENNTSRLGRRGIRRIQKGWAKRRGRLWRRSFSFLSRQYDGLIIPDWERGERTGSNELGSSPAGGKIPTAAVMSLRGKKAVGGIKRA